MRRSKRIWIFFALAWAFAAQVSMVRADGVIRPGLGPRAVGRGGSNLAFADNGQVILDNPAAMIDIAGRGLSEISVDVLLTDLDYQDPQNNVTGVVKPYPMPQMAYIQKDPSEIWAFGLGIYAPAGFGAEYDMVHPVFGQHRQKSLGALAKVLPAVAVAVTDRLSVGAALGLAASHVELEGAFHLQSGPLPGAPSLLDLQSTGADIAWNAGIRYAVSSNLFVGVAFTGETSVRMDGTATAFIPGGIGSSSFDADVHLTWPRTLGLGVLFTPSCCHRLSTDVIWYNWSDAFDEIGLTLNAPSNPIVAGLLGNTFHDRFPLDWQDSISVRLGYEYAMSSVSTLRGGYMYHSNPIPNSTLTPYIPAILEHALSIGFGRRICEVDFDMAYQFSWGEPETVGTSSILGGDFDNSRMKTQAHWLSLGFIRQF